MEFKVTEVFDQKKYVQTYIKDNVKQIKFGLNRKTEADLLEWLEQQPNKQGYIKELIRKDMEEKTMISVTLSNKDSIFDSAKVATIGEAIEFAKGRGGKYSVQIGRNANVGISLSYDSDKDEFKRFDGWDWETIKEDEIKDLI